MSLRRITLVVLTLGLATAMGRSEDGATIRDPQVGICTHFAFGGSGWPPGYITPIIARTGAGWIRDDLFWSRVERSPGVYAIPKDTLAWIDAVHAAGIKIDLIFNYGNKIYPDPYDPQAYAKAAAWTAAELAGKIDAIEIMNEPANFGFSKHYDGEQAWSGLKADGTVATYIGKYVTLLNTAAKAIRAANPNIKIIGLGCSAGANFRALALGIAPEVDGVTDHPYSAHSMPEHVPFDDNASTRKRDGIATADAHGSFASQLAMYQAQSAKYQGPKELWLTEQGWPTFHPATPFGLFTGVDDLTQAKYILRRLTEARGMGAACTFVYDLRDDGASPGNPEHHFGFFDFKMKPKPSYFALQHYCATMSGFERQTDLKADIALKGSPGSAMFGPDKTAGADAVRSYGFADRKGAKRVAVWYADRETGIDATVRIKSTQALSSIRADDPLTGKTWSIPCRSESGELVLEGFKLTDSPILLTLTAAP